MRWIIKFTLRMRQIIGGSKAEETFKENIKKYTK